MSNMLFDSNLSTLKYLGFITHNSENEITETARRVCYRLASENIQLSAFGVMCGTFAGKYWNEEKRGES